MPLIEITTMVGCRLRCTFCPQETLIKAYKLRLAETASPPDPANESRDAYYLSIENFKKTIDKLPEYVKLSFAGMSEPWLNFNCTDMLAYALSKGFKISIYTTLVGMTAKNAETVCDLLRHYANQMINVSIHLPDAQNHMRGWKITNDYKQALESFIALQNEQKLPHLGMMSMDAQGNLHPELNYLGWKLSDFRPSSRSGNVISDCALKFAYK